MTIDKSALKALAQHVIDLELTEDQPIGDAWNEFEAAANPAAVLALLAEIDRLAGARPDASPRPPEGEGLPRYGLRWNGPTSPITVPMPDGYWTPWHLADQLKAENGSLRKDAELNNRRLRTVCIIIDEICEALGIDNHSEPDMIVESARELKSKAT
jgi:hypothetical protein